MLTKKYNQLKQSNSECTRELASLIQEKVELYFTDISKISSEQREILLVINFAFNVNHIFNNNLIKSLFKLIKACVFLGSKHI